MADRQQRPQVELCVLNVEERLSPDGHAHHIANTDGNPNSMPKPVTLRKVIRDKKVAEDAAEVKNTIRWYGSKSWPHFQPF